MKILHFSGVSIIKQKENHKKIEKHKTKRKYNKYERKLFEA